MRDTNRAERLLSLFTSPESAAGIVGDLSEERGQRGTLWFWRQVLGTLFCLCRGTLYESPVAVLLLAASGFALSAGVSGVTQVVVVDLIGFRTLKGDWANLAIFLLPALIRWPAGLVAGATMVAAAPRLGMAACAMLGGVELMLSVLFMPLSYFVAVYAGPFHASAFWWLNWHVSLASSLLLLLGGAMIQRRWNARRPRATE